MDRKELETPMARGLNSEQAVELIVSDILRYAEPCANHSPARSCGSLGDRIGVLNDGSAFEASIERTFFFILAAYAIDESHVETGECRCHSWIEFRTTHRDLPESRRTIPDLFLNECGPTLSDLCGLHTRNC